jgi:homoserine kinase type II
MATYSRLDENDIARLQVEYNTTFQKIEPIDGGAANSSFLAEANGGPLVITVLDSHTKDSAESLVMTTRAVSNGGIRVPEFIENSSGRLLTPLGDRIVAIKRYEVGVIPELLDVAQCGQAGAQLALVHGCPLPERTPRPDRKLPADYVSQVAAFADRDFAEWVLTQAALLNIPEDMPRGLVHGDLFPDNIVVTDDGTLVFLDWEDAANEALIIDIGMAIVGLCRNRTDLLLSHANAFLEGYQTVRTLAECEVNRLAESIKYAAAITAFYRYLRHVVRFPNPARTDYYREMIPFVDSVDSHRLKFRLHKQIGNSGGVRSPR